MLDFQTINDLVQSSDKKIIMLVMDGLGGLPREEGGKTELESARTPNMDGLAKRGVLGLHVPISHGITPGSGPAHLALFGYDPVKNQIGRGVLEALGIDFDLLDTDVAARGNFATVDASGIITDRRAGRITTDKSTKLVELMDNLPLSSGQAIVRPVKDHRFVAVFRGAGLSDSLTDSDPNRTGEKPLAVRATNAESEATAKLVNEFIEKAMAVLADHAPANAGLLRGFAKHPKLPTIDQIFGIRAAAIAIYPMYRGLAKLVGMKALDAGATLADQVACLSKSYADHDFFFFHVKATDAAGEDGDFDRKVAAIEAVDAIIPDIMKLDPDVLLITGDHSTPAALKGHSWHPVPMLLFSKNERPDSCVSFGERACSAGGLGVIPAMEVMPILLGNALRLTKFGA